MNTQSKPVEQHTLPKMQRRVERLVCIEEKLSTEIDVAYQRGSSRDRVSASFLVAFVERLQESVSVDVRE
jgi:hypothetical protein